MAINAVLAGKNTTNFNSTTGTTLTVTAVAPAANSGLIVWATWDDTNTQTAQCSDPTDGVYTLPTPQSGTNPRNDATDGQCFAMFYLPKSPTGGSRTVTVTFGSIASPVAVAFRSVKVFELSGQETGVADSYDGSATNLQTAPGTGADAVVSGNMSNTKTAAGIVCTTWDVTTQANTPSAGTGATSIDSDVNDGSRTQFKRITTTGTVQGTMTANAAGGSNPHATMAIIFDELGATGGGAISPPGDTSPPVARAQRRQIPENVQPLPVKPGPVSKNVEVSEAIREKMPPRPQPDSPDPRPLKPGPTSALVQNHLPERELMPRRPQPDNPQPLRSPANPVLTGLNTDQTSPVEIPPRRPADNTPPLPRLIQPPPGLTHEWAPGRRTRAPFPVDPQPLPAPVNAPTTLLTVHGSGRYLLNNGAPWPMFTRTVWGLVGVTVAQYQAIIDDTAAKGYTCIEFSAIHHDNRSTWVPFDGAGNLPFTNTLTGAAWTGGLWPSVTSTNMADFTTPVTAYWNRVRDIVDYAALKGLVCFLFASYTGIGGADGWLNEMIQNGLTNMSTHGAFVANLLKARSNIVWGMGGDKGTGSGAYSAPELAAEQGFVQGLLSVSGPASTMFGAEWTSPSIMADQTDHVTGTTGPTFGDTGTIETYYNFAGSVGAQGTTAWNSSPTKPAVLQEGPFEDEGPFADNTPFGTADNSASTRPVRRYHIGATLAGIAGYNAGNAYVWRTNTSGTLPGADDYRNHLNSTTAQENALWHSLYRTYSWWLYIPSAQSGMVTIAALNAGNQSLNAACASDGSSALVYSWPDGNGGSITVNLTRLNNNIRAQWWNPSTGAFSTGGGAAGTFSLSNSATAQAFTPPGANGSGFNDWVLVLDTVPPISAHVPEADARKQATNRSPHRHLSADPMPTAISPVLASFAPQPDALVEARAPRPNRAIAGAEPPEPLLILPWIDVPPAATEARTSRQVQTTPGAEPPEPGLILPWIVPDPIGPESRSTGPARSVPILDPTLPNLILPWADSLPAGPEARGRRADLREANHLTLPPPPFTPSGFETSTAPGRPTTKQPPLSPENTPLPPPPFTPSGFETTPPGGRATVRPSLSPENAPMPPPPFTPGGFEPTAPGARALLRPAQSPENAALPTAGAPALTAGGFDAPAAPARAARARPAPAAETLPPPPFTPGGFDLPWAPGRPTRAPAPTWGDVAAALVFPWTPEAAVITWRPTRATAPGQGEPEPAPFFVWAPDPTIYAARAQRPPVITWGESSAPIVFAWSPDPAAIAAQRPRRADLRQVLGEPLPAVVIAAFTSWGFEPAPPPPRARYTARDRLTLNGESLPVMPGPAFTSWGFEPWSPGARLARLDRRGAGGDPLAALLAAAFAGFDAPAPGARAQTADRRGVPGEALPALTLIWGFDLPAPARGRAPSRYVTASSEAVPATLLTWWVEAAPTPERATPRAASASSDPPAGATSPIWMPDTAPARAARILRHDGRPATDAPPPLLRLPTTVFDPSAPISRAHRSRPAYGAEPLPARIIPPLLTPWGYEPASPIIRNVPLTWVRMQGNGLSLVLVMARLPMAPLGRGGTRGGGLPGPTSGTPGFRGPTRGTR